MDKTGIWPVSGWPTFFVQQDILPSFRQRTHVTCEVLQESDTPMPQFRPNFLQGGKRRVDVAEGDVKAALPGSLGDRDRRG